jgi:hypothetical protein
MGETSGRQTGGGAKFSTNTAADACQNTMTDTKSDRPRNMTLLFSPLAEHRARRWRKDYSGAPHRDRKLMVQRTHFLVFGVE